MNWWCSGNFACMSGTMMPMCEIFCGTQWPNWFCFNFQRWVSVPFQCPLPLRRRRRGGDVNRRGEYRRCATRQPNENAMRHVSEQRDNARHPRRKTHVGSVMPLQFQLHVERRPPRRWMYIVGVMRRGNPSHGARKPWRLRPLAAQDMPRWCPRNDKTKPQRLWPLAAIVTREQREPCVPQRRHHSMPDCRRSWREFSSAAS